MSNLEVTSQQETKSTPKKQTKYIHKATIRKDDDSVFITYRNSSGKNVTYQPKCDGTNNFAWSATLLFNTVNKYFTGKSPNITPEEQVQLRADIAKQKVPIAGISSSNSGWTELDVYGGIDFVLKTFSDESSEGGKNITPNEVYQMYEMFHKWTE